MAWLLATSATLMASDAETNNNILFNIPQQRADLAITLFAEQANLTLVFPFDEIQGKTANRLVGEYPIEEAIEILLSGTGLTPTFRSNLVLNIATESKSEPEGAEMNVKKKAGLGALFAAVFSVGANAQESANTDEAGQALDEITVTGSYLKRSAADSPSPLSVVTAANIEDLGAADIAEIIQAMPWSSGSQTRAATFGGGGAEGRTSINLRNLGQASTLPLVNGKRQVASWYNGRGNASVNVNGLVPNIALERVEIVKDGASALYGSDAVAGVVNFITRKDFEGMDFSMQYTVDDETGEGGASQFGVIWGTQGDRGGIVVSASLLDRNEINVDDNYGRYGGTAVSSTGQPGRLTPVSGQTIIWAANGLRPGMEVDEVIDGGTLPRNAMGTSFGSADVDCEASAALEQGGPLGDLFNRCIYDFGSFFPIQANERLTKIHVDGHYEASENVDLYFEFATNDSSYNAKSSLAPNAPALTIPTGTEYIDANGVVQVALNPGSQEDAFRRGIVPIEYVNLTRLIGGTRNTPESLRPIDTFTDIERSDNRYVVGATWEINDNWVLDASYTGSQHNTAYVDTQDTLSSNMSLALNGFGGPECNPLTGVPGEGNAAYAASGGDFDAGSCYFFNPFGSSQFDRSGTLGQDDLALVNDAALYQWLQGRATTARDYRQNVIDIVTTGTLAEMSSGPLGVAIGFQQRRDTGQVLYDSALVTGNLDFNFGASDWDGSLTTNAVFVELGIPLLDNLDINVAVRYEDFDELGESSTDPKISVLWRPIDSLSLRASAGSSFRVPSLLQSFGTLTSVGNLNDIVSGTSSRPSLTTGNPNLQPESADTFNIGLSWTPLDGLLFDLDYYQYQYEDIITRQSSSTLLAADNAALAAYVAANPGSDFVDAVNAGAGNPAQVIRNSQAVLLRVLPDFFNANGSDISGIDLNAAYRWDTSNSGWRVGLQSAFVLKYDVEVPDGAGGLTILDSVGQYNGDNPVARPLPEYQVNATLNWDRNQHSAFMIVKHIPELEGEDLGFGGFLQGTARLAGNDDVADDLADGVIKSMTTVDAQYTYTFDDGGGFLSRMNLSVGVLNMFDIEAPVLVEITAYDPRLHDGRGRMFFVRLGGSL